MANTHSIIQDNSPTDNGQYLSIATSTDWDLTTTNDRTFEAWFKVGTLVTNGGLFTRWSNEGGNNKNLLVRLTSSGTIQAYVGSGASTGVNVTGSTSISGGSWHHVAITWNGSGDDKLRIYVDGTLDATFASAGSPGAATSTLIVGGKTGLSGVANDITVDDVRVWNTARTQSEIDTNKSVELVGNETGLLHYWKLNNDLTDEVSGGTSLTNNGSMSFTADPAFTSGGGGYAFSQSVVIA